MSASTKPIESAEIATLISLAVGKTREELEETRNAQDNLLIAMLTLTRFLLFQTQAKFGYYLPPLEISFNVSHDGFGEAVIGLQGKNIPLEVKSGAVIVHERISRFDPYGNLTSEEAGFLRHLIEIPGNKWGTEFAQHSGSVGVGKLVLMFG
ncbi:MAG: hypothetical protein UX89_C0020G0015 [Parcubacteria group bacterium GW2011_GWA2_47_16]|nr:MAG: hypothetical protein UX89_C0020G0015 [Parcubacteria group bacterium GW2011_GWA2_47_16]